MHDEFCKQRCFLLYRYCPNPTIEPGRNENYAMWNEWEQLQRVFLAYRWTIQEKAQHRQSKHSDGSPDAILAGYRSDVNRHTYISPKWHELSPFRKLQEATNSSDQKFQNQLPAGLSITAVGLNKIWGHLSRHVGIMNVRLAELYQSHSVIPRLIGNLGPKRFCGVWIVRWTVSYSDRRPSAE